jgi:hypothetical protein
MINWVLDYVTTLINYIAYITSNGRMITNVEREELWKNAIVTYFRTIYQHLLGGTEENHYSW